MWRIWNTVTASPFFVVFLWFFYKAHHIWLYSLMCSSLQELFLYFTHGMDMYWLHETTYELKDTGVLSSIIVLWNSMNRSTPCRKWHFWSNFMHAWIRTTNTIVKSLFFFSQQIINLLHCMTGQLILPCGPQILWAKWCTCLTFFLKKLG